MSDQVSVRYLHSVRQVDEHEIRSLHFTTIWSDVGKSVQDVGKFICREVLRLIVSPVDSPYALSTTWAFLRRCRHLPIHKVRNSLEFSAALHAESFGIGTVTVRNVYTFEIRDQVTGQQSEQERDNCKNAAEIES